MTRLWTFLLDPRVLGVLGFAALAAFLFLGADALKLGLVWVTLGLGLVLLVWGGIWLYRAWRARRASKALEAGVAEGGVRTAPGASAKGEDMGELRKRLHAAIKTVQTSKLGELSGSAALYELPWYLVIGNPLAGKTTAIVRSGLNFPFAAEQGHAVRGIGGTRNCDWYFTSEGILIDTAGRYAVHQEDEREWLGFLDLLKRHRPKAPINGIIVAASAAEIAEGRPEDAIALAKNLRQRVQELTERLEVFAPVYVVFTKTDLISGFAEFFAETEGAERDRVWGATLGYQPPRAQPAKQAQTQAHVPKGSGASGVATASAPAAEGTASANALTLFERHFDELADGLKELSVARMAAHRGKALPPGVLSFPLDFAALKPALRSFIATLFDDNAFQIQPIFRGFYFTSALLEGDTASPASARLVKQFALRGLPQSLDLQLDGASSGFFLRDLFAKVIFADRELVRQYSSRRKLRWRLWTASVGLAVLALALSAWSYSWLGNRQYMDGVRADLEAVARLQTERSDLGSRLQALELLQGRIEELGRWRQDRPLGLRFGLYQGDQIEAQLKRVYFDGIRLVMLEPVFHSVESYLKEVNRDPGRLKPMVQAPSSGAATLDTAAPRQRNVGSRFIDASVQDSTDAYQALKTYLMLGDRSRLEASHLHDQITRFWRVWLDDNRGTQPREAMMRSAGSLITFTTSLVGDPDFPVLKKQVTLVDDTRRSLLNVTQGMKATERVYADIKTRAATRYPPLTVAGLITETDKGLVAGSHAVPGPFTREAWKGYIEEEFNKAAKSPSNSRDWVLDVASDSDLTLVGSPDQIRKELIELYKGEYVQEWRTFIQGVQVPEFGSFERAVAGMNRLGDPANSPIKRVMELLFDQTSWDNPSVLNERLAKTQSGFLDWFKATVLGMAPSRVDVNVNLSAGQAQLQMGAIGKEFAPLAKLMLPRDGAPATMADYLRALGDLRTKLNQINNQSNPGPGARTLVAQTLEGGGELGAALKVVDERMLVGMTVSARDALRPLLVRPLTQTLAALVPAAEAELNRLWKAQVSDPFESTLAPKAPFDPSSRVEATDGDINKLLGPGGAVAKFGAEGLAQLVNNRGNALEPRTWADVGIRLRADFAAGYPKWVSYADGGAPTAAAAAGAPPGAAPRVDNQTVLEVKPLGAPGLDEYTFTLDGQVLRYRNGASEWTRMVYPGPDSSGGVKLTGITSDKKAVEFLAVPGRDGLDAWVRAAQRRRIAKGHNELTLTSGKHAVSIEVRVVSQPGPVGGAGGGAEPVIVTGRAMLRGLRLPKLAVGTDATAGPLATPAGSPTAAWNSPPGTGNRP